MGAPSDMKTKPTPVTSIADIISRESIHFLDFGCSTGGSLKRFSEMMYDSYGGNCRGLGLDIDPKKVDAVRKAGFSACQFDIRDLAVAGIKVNFVTMSHFLEHIGNPADVTQIIKVACYVARQFVLIVQPSFDADGLLMRMGLKPYWSDWSGHPNHMSSLELHNILYPLYKSNAIAGFKIYGRDQIASAADRRIVPLSAPGNSQKRDPKDDAAVVKAGGTRPFPFPVHSETVAIIEKRECPYDLIEKKLGKMEEIFFTSSKMRV